MLRNTDKYQGYVNVRVDLPDGKRNVQMWFDNFYNVEHGMDFLASKYLDGWNFRYAYFTYYSPDMSKPNRKPGIRIYPQDIIKQASNPTYQQRMKIDYLLFGKVSQREGNSVNNNISKAYPFLYRIILFSGLSSI